MWPSKEPDQYAPAATPVSPSSATYPYSTSNSSSPSPWGPYSKSGRGGAGNFTWQIAPQSPTTLDPDPEPGLKQQSSLTARQKAAAEVEARDRADILAAKQQSVRSEYTHVGRGGAGNYTPSTEMIPSAPAPEEASHSSQPSQPSQPAPGSGSGPPLSTVDPLLAAKSGYYGRGGAGNYGLDFEAAAAKREAEVLDRRRREEHVRRLVEESVEAEMRRPEGAVTREGRGREF